jgi:hypothetical protein
MKNPYSQSLVLPTGLTQWVAWQAASVLPLSKTTYPKESFQLKNFHSISASKSKDLFLDNKQSADSDKLNQFLPTLPSYLGIIQGDQKVSVHLMITVQKTRKNILNSLDHLPW